MTNCYDGNGGEEVGLLGYFSTLNDCKAACVASTSCEAITVNTGTRMACNAVRNVAVDQCSTRTTVWSTYVLLSPPSGAQRLSGLPGPQVIATWNINPNATTAPSGAEQPADGDQLLLLVLVGVAALAVVVAVAAFVVLKSRKGGKDKLSIGSVVVVSDRSAAAGPSAIQVVSHSAEKATEEPVAAPEDPQDGWA
jgi:hypothetical protein